ncbi:MAG: hypothetical protein AB7P03_05360 [Kofleriaceae bacterium]
MAADDPSGKRPAPVVLRIKLRYDGVDAMIQRFAPNVGKTGLFLPTKSLQPIGAEIKFELRLADDTPVLVGLGRVKVAKPPDPANPRAAFGMAVELLRVTRESRDLILRMLERRKQLGLTDPGLPMPSDIDAARRIDLIDTGVRDAVSAGVPTHMLQPEPSSGPLLTEPRRPSSPGTVAPPAALSALEPEAPRRKRARLSELIERASGAVEAVASTPELDQDIDVGAAMARARSLAGSDLDAELEALREAAAAPVEVNVDAASAELARRLGGSEVSRSARWAPPPAAISSPLSPPISSPPRVIDHEAPAEPHAPEAVDSAPVIEPAPEAVDSAPVIEPAPEAVDSAPGVEHDAPSTVATSTEPPLGSLSAGSMPVPAVFELRSEPEAAAFESAHEPPEPAVFELPSESGEPDEPDDPDEPDEPDEPGEPDEPDERDEPEPVAFESGQAVAGDAGREPADVEATPAPAVIEPSGITATPYLSIGDNTPLTEPIERLDVEPEPAFDSGPTVKAEEAAQPASAATLGAEPMLDDPAEPSDDRSQYQSQPSIEVEPDQIAEETNLFDEVERTQLGNSPLDAAAFDSESLAQQLDDELAQAEHDDLGLSGPVPIAPEPTVDRDGGDDDEEDSSDESSITEDVDPVRVAAAAALDLDEIEEIDDFEILDDDDPIEADPIEAANRDSDFAMRLDLGDSDPDLRIGPPISEVFKARVGADDGGEDSGGVSDALAALEAIDEPPSQERSRFDDPLSFGSDPDDEDSGDPRAYTIAEPVTNQVIEFDSPHVGHPPAHEFDDSDVIPPSRTGRGRLNTAPPLDPRTLRRHHTQAPAASDDDSLDLEAALDALDVDLDDLAVPSEVPGRGPAQRLHRASNDPSRKNAPRAPTDDGVLIDFDDDE